jgi:hypothetical protein
MKRRAYVLWVSAAAALTLAVSLALFVATPGTSSADDPVQFSLDSDSYSADVGDTFHVKVNLGELTNSVSWFNFLLPFDFDHLQLVATTPADPTPCKWDLAGYATLWMDPDLWGMALYVDCYRAGGADPPQSGTVELIDFEFRCLAEYSGSLQINQTWGGVTAIDQDDNDYNAVGGPAASVDCNVEATATHAPRRATATPGPVSTPLATATPGSAPPQAPVSQPPSSPPNLGGVGPAVAPPSTGGGPPATDNRWDLAIVGLLSIAALSGLTLAHLALARQRE